MTISRAVLVTGCSTGIGRATALRLHKAGLPVYATARRPEAIRDLPQLGIRTLQLDVTDEASMRAAVDRVTSDHGAVGVLVNNAGYWLAGPVEETSPAEVSRQFETNVLGLIRLTQLVLPAMRAQRFGRIVNLSSIYGRFAVPGGAFYDATKHAVSAFTDALRQEVAPLGIGVALIEPGATRTQLDANTIWTGDADGPYARFRERLIAWHADVYRQPSHNIAGRLAVEADDVARAIEAAITAPWPCARYPVGVLAHGLFFLRRWLPTRAFDAFVRRVFPAP